MCITTLPTRVVIVNKMYDYRVFWVFVSLSTPRVLRPQPFVVGRGPDLFVFFFLSGKNRHLEKKTTAFFGHKLNARYSYYTMKHYSKDDLLQFSRTHEKLCTTLV